MVPTGHHQHLLQHTPLSARMEHTSPNLTTGVCEYIPKICSPQNGPPTTLKNLHMLATPTCLVGPPLPPPSGSERTCGGPLLPVTHLDNGCAQVPIDDQPLDPVAPQQLQELGIADAHVTHKTSLRHLAPWTHIDTYSKTIDTFWCYLNSYMAWSSLAWTP